MPAAIALSAPYLSWWDRKNPKEDEPLIICDYAILPTGSMLQADQLMYGSIGSQGVLSSAEPKVMVASESNRIEIFPLHSADYEKVREYSEMLATEFVLKLDRLKMFEYATADQNGQQ